jgi:PadR family transcriptional regulator, regulatory protein AphA
MSSLSPTARVILGMLGLGLRTGYEVKRLSEESTRFFWGASFGQIYPELRRLEAQGLVEAEDDPRGGVKRRAHRLTDEGRARLREWLTSRDPLLFEYRDEGLLKLFFGDLVEREETLANLRRLRDEHRQDATFFRETLEPRATQQAEETGLEFPIVALRYGIELLDWMADWAERAEAELSAAPARPSPPGETAAQDPPSASP